MQRITKEKICIVIPMHKAKMNPNEKVSLARCKEVFKDFKVILVVPEGLDVSEYQESGAIGEIKYLQGKYFKSEKMYNRLLNITYFYKHFLEYEYMLLYQLDTFVFENNLEYWCNQGYDYIGAPWIDATWINKLVEKYKMPFIKKMIYKVGNGGLSLRRIRTFYKGSIYLRPLAYLWNDQWHEDFFWSSVAHRLMPSFRIPDVNTALKFAFEEHPSTCYEMNNKMLPFGCHAWEKFDTDFWRPHFEKYGYRI
jgi:hypothetical protein